MRGLASAEVTFESLGVASGIPQTKITYYSLLTLGGSIPK